MLQCSGIIRRCLVYIPGDIPAKIMNLDNTQPLYYIYYYDVLLILLIPRSCIIIAGAIAVVLCKHLCAVKSFIVTTHCYYCIGMLKDLRKNLQNK